MANNKVGELETIRAADAVFQCETESETITNTVGCVHVELVACSADISNSDWPW